MHLFEHARDLIEPRFGFRKSGFGKSPLRHAFADLLRAQQRGEAFGYVVDALRERRLVFFGHLVFIPHGKRAVGSRRLVLPEYMGMPPDEFGAQTARHIPHREPAAFLFDERMKKRLHEHVARFLAHAFGILAVDRVHQLIGLFERVDADTLVRLRSVPRAAVGRAQAFEDRHAVVEGKTLFFEQRHVVHHDARPRIIFLPVEFVKRNALLAVRTHEECLGFVAAALG